MTEPDVDALFHGIVTHPRLVWSASNTGCEAKADLMAEYAHERGYDVCKIWVQPSDSESHLLVYLNAAKTETMLWGYHVAIMVRSEGTGEAGELVLDPSFFGRPVTLDEWKRRVCLLTDEYGMQMEFVTSASEAFYGPRDMSVVGSRQRGLAKRDEILSNAANLDDPTVFSGFLMKRRGDFADRLKCENPKKFRKLKAFLRNDYFANWYRISLRNGALAHLLESHERYFGIATSAIRARIDLADECAFVALIEAYWESVGTAIERLKERSEALLGGGFTGETMAFQIRWENKDFRIRWFSPTSDDLWTQHGIRPEALPG